MADGGPQPSGEVAALVAVQSALGQRPGVVGAARAMSHFGEHSAGWLAVSALGAVAQPRRRREWLLAGAGALSAHATSTTTAAILMAPLTGLPLPVLVVPPMALSRLVLGVHYPSDVLTGVAVGALVARLVRKIGSRR
jgi:hypothetical protein